MYNGESQLFYLRLRLLDPFIDYFLVGYSCFTFQGDPNPPLSFSPLESEISYYSTKIKIFTKCEDSADEVSHSWDREARLRGFLHNSGASLHPKPTDLIISCDADEIPIPAGLQWIYDHPPTTFYKFRGYYFMYTFRWWMAGEPWIKPFVVRWFALDSLQALRKQGRHRTPNFTLIHCTYCFPDIETVRRKLRSFCHSEYAKEPFVNPNYIAAAAKCGKGMIPSHAERIVSYKGDINQILPFQHPELEFLRNEFGFRNLSGTTQEEVEHFLRYINCTKKEAFE
jgi:hypothetical protein